MKSSQHSFGSSKCHSAAGSNRTSAKGQPADCRPGWLCCQEDVEHLQLSATAFRLPKNSEDPQELDPRGWMRLRGPFSKRLGCGHAVATCLEYLHFLITGGRRIRLSATFAYLTALKMDGNFGRDPGCTISGAVKAAKVFGVCREKQFRPPRFDTDSLPVSALTRAAAHRIVSHSLLSSYDQTSRYLAGGCGAVLLGVPWHSSLHLAGERIESAEGPLYGWHSLAIVGYVSGVRDSRGRKYLIAANSDGPRWGQAGFALIAPHLVDEWGDDKGSLIVGLSDLRAYRRRAVDCISRRSIHETNAHQPRTDRAHEALTGNLDMPGETRS